MNSLKNVKSSRPPIISIILFCLSTAIVCISNLYIDNKNAQIPVMSFGQVLSFVAMIFKMDKNGIQIPNEVNDPFQSSAQIENAINPINEIPIVDSLNQDTILASSNIQLPV